MTPESDAIHCELNAKGVARITLNRPTQHHAFNALMIKQIHDALETFSQNSSVRLLIFKSSGPIFSSGGDLTWLKKSKELSEQENQIDASHLAKMLYQIDKFPKPTLAAIQGPVYGGGVGLVACCKIAIASELAQFAFSEVKLGMIPAAISPYIIKAIGLRTSLAYFLSGRSFDAKHAYNMGLCQEVVPHDSLDEVVEQWTDALLAGGPCAQEEIIQLVDTLSPSFDSSIIETTAKRLAQIRVSPEGQEGISAFLNKRKPNWNP